MSSDRPKRESMSLEEATISNMWEIAAIVELLEKKGLCTKQDLYDIIDEFRSKNPKARLPETVFPSPYLMTQTEEQVIDDIIAVLNHHGMDSKQALELLEQVGRIIEMGARMTRETTHKARMKLTQLLAGCVLILSGSAPLPCQSYIETQLFAGEVERRGCRSRHAGVCGCDSGRAVCCDGRLSPTCGC
ncbi:hypothetical protein YTPLAS72_02100 [Nitrospira sp.]|nr:hypothetical protein YTPLAS72_02100 [Nitrospira sp.]